MKNTVARTFIAVVALCGFAASPVAMAVDDPTISNVFFDFDSTPKMLHIIGRNFTAPSTVALGTLEVTVAEATTSVLSAELPVLANGDYLLTVTTAKDSGKGANSVTYALTYSTPEPTYEIGDTGPGGGFVFYLTADGMHGLEAAPVDQLDVQWGCIGVSIPGTLGIAVGAGAGNTEAIRQSCETVGIAADLAANYVSPAGYFDWYLPSKDELNLMYQNLHLAGQGGFDGLRDGYWSSSEFVDPSNLDVRKIRAWVQSFADGHQAGGLKDHYLRLAVRFVRAF